MSRLIESIRLYNGVFNRLDWHQKRINKAFDELFHSSPNWRLENILMESDYPSNGVYKCRVIYDDMSIKIEYEPYHPKIINSLRVVDGNDLHYSYKFEDRSGINDLYELRDGCDDILIMKKGFVSDTSFANIVFQKNNLWFTPDTPLLDGTMRQFLLNAKVISVTSIRKSDIMRYESFKLINSMLEWENLEVPVSNIKLNDD